MAHRINERNSGYWSLDGGLKNRNFKRRKPGVIASAEEHELVMGIIEKVFEAMAFDPGLSECGHLDPEAKFTDGGRFMACLSRKQYETLSDIIYGT
ncbi:MAG: hypothetical protein KDC70_00335 [Saprospiraceae bacterium]|nr:hypothetical protein [Saprospiraceae bacterium]